MRRKSTFIVGILALLVIVFIGNFKAQNLSQLAWIDVQEENIRSNRQRYIIPNTYRTLELDFEKIKSFLQNAPDEYLTPIYRSEFIMYMPMPDGEFERFKIVESPVMADDLANKFPDIKTYLGQGIDDRTASIRFDLTPIGFHAMVLSVNGTMLIDPYSKGETQYYISYYKKDYSPTEDTLNFSCIVDGINSPAVQELRNLVEQEFDLATGEELRTYRLACAATGEYTNFHGGTVAAGMAAIVVAINRVTEVYERELSVRMELIANNDQIIYTNPSTDPYTNSSGFTMLSENQSNLDAVIGSANYDIGHVFSTGGGGVASLAAVCRNGVKARGVTGLTSPIGDVFYVDYVAHEMGHQFGGNHTFNGSSGSCSGGNRNPSTSYEPGSGSTIQAYAGICFPQNLQNNSDDYFHNISYVEMSTYTQVGGGSSCPAVTSTGNSPPVIGTLTGGLTFPINTPLKLDGSATDPDGDDLTYNWEEFDLGPTGHPNSPSGNSPIFRSFPASTETYRLLPKLSNLLNNTQTIGEILPTYSRALNFRLTVRDNRAGGGGIGWVQVSYSLTDAAGPFLVTTPNTSETWLGSSFETITWDVANTSAAPVSVAEVNILLSTDGGVTWPFTLASNTPNDGSETVLIPNEPTTQARVMVEPVGNLFFDISNEDFTITFNPIPVELTMFVATALKDRVKLFWRTATETNNAGFSVERSSDNKSFYEITFVQGNGTTTEIHDYTYTDRNTNSGTYYYRLKQIDYDGTINYSESVELDISVPEVFLLSQNYPNPFNPSTKIKFSLPVDSKIRIVLFNTLGEEIDLLAEGEYSVGYHNISFDASNLSNGVYYYTLSAEGTDGSSFVSTKKMVLLK
jgi:hypothetical protein